MNGITIATFVAMLCGVYLHVSKQMRAAKKLDVPINLLTYFKDNRPETVASIICGLIGYLALPELAHQFPSVATTMGLGEHQTVLSSFIVGYMGNSLADFIGGRAEKLAG